MMPLYEYVCGDCGPFDTMVRADGHECPSCGADARRNWRFTPDPGFEPHYSPVFGQVIRSRSHAKSLAAYQSEKQSFETGRDVDYQLVDLHDDAAVNITAEDKEKYLDATRRAAVDGATKAPERKAERQKVDA